MNKRDQHFNKNLKQKHYSTLQKVFRVDSNVALWLYTIIVILTKQKFSVGCVMELAFQLTHNSRSSIGYQTVTDAHENKGLKGSNSLL